MHLQTEGVNIVVKVDTQSLFLINLLKLYVGMHRILVFRQWSVALALLNCVCVL